MQPKISVLMPLYNEEAYIQQTIASLFAQDYPADLTEWVFVDGNSSDRTLQLLREAIAARPQVQILDNPQRQIAAASNIGIRAAHGEIIVRMDAHTFYAPDYIRVGIETLFSTGADIVGGPALAAGQTEKQQAIAAAFNSPFALGGGHAHSESYEGWCSAVYYGIYRRQFALDLSLYDETLLKSEDDDFFFRARKAGAKIYITPKMRMVYHPRSNFSSLWKQYYLFGYWKWAFLRKHKAPVSLLQLVPFCFIAFLTLGGALCFWHSFRFLYSGIVALYLLLNLFFAASNRQARSIRQKAMLFWACIVIHVAYGLGGWRCLFQCKRKSR